MNTTTRPFELSYWTRDCDRATTLVVDRQFRLDLSGPDRVGLDDLPDYAIDFLRIAAAVYLVDRRIARRPKDDARPGSRSVGVRVEVLNPGLWNEPEVRDSLCTILDFVTGDFWEAEFVRDTRPQPQPTRRLPIAVHDDPLICLYSGGLDSAAGLATRMRDFPGRSVIAVTVRHQPSQQLRVLKQYELLGECFDGTEIEPLIVKVAMRWTGREGRNQESSQRARAFLFAGLGAIVAQLYGQDTVEMFESGIGAINVPLMSGMTGWRTTRSSHPEFLRIVSKLVSRIADREVSLTLPFLWRTKGEVATALRVPDLRPLATASASCIHFPLREREFKQCGVCPACIFRRVALSTAGIDEAEDAYKHDFLGFTDERVTFLPVDGLDYLKAFLMQVVRLDWIERHERLPPPIERHILSTGILRRGDSQRDVIALLARHRDEWLQVVANARARGHRWAHLLTPTGPLAVGAIHASA